MFKKNISKIADQYDQYFKLLKYKCIFHIATNFNQNKKIIL